MNELQSNNITILKGTQLKIFEAQLADHICNMYHSKIYEGDLFGKLLCSEMKKITDYERKTSIKLCHVVYKPGIQYNLYRNEVDKENESLMSDVNTLLFKIENGIRLIHNAKSPEEVEKDFSYLFDTTTQNSEKNKKTQGENWKDEYIQHLIKYHTSDPIALPNMRYYADGLVTSIIYHSANTCKEITSMGHTWCEMSECKQSKECTCRLNCETLSNAKARLFSLRELLWDYIGDKLPNHLSDELREFTETIEWICIYYFS